MRFTPFIFIAGAAVLLGVGCDTSRLVEIGPPVATVTVTPASANLQVGGTQQLGAALTDANGDAITGRAITWASGNTNIATVNGSGMVTGIAAGGTTVTATSEGMSGSATVTVTGGPPPPPDATPPSTPQNLVALAVGPTQVNLSWSASTDNVGVTGYRVFRNSTQVGTPAPPAFQDANLTPSTTYSYTVAAVDAAPADHGRRGASGRPTGGSAVRTRRP